jgi:hypothetical protein
MALLSVKLILYGLLFVAICGTVALTVRTLLNFSFLRRAHDSIISSAFVLYQNRRTPKFRSGDERIVLLIFSSS